MKSQPSLGRACHLIVVGDFVIDFLLADPLFSSPMVHLYSVFGTGIGQLRGETSRLSDRHVPKVIIFHAGVNNLSKEYL